VDAQRARGGPVSHKKLEFEIMSTMTLFEKNREREHAISKAEVIVKAAENQKRALTFHENLEYESCMETAKKLGGEIAAIRSKNTISGMFDKTGMPRFMGSEEGRPFSNPTKKVFTSEYAEDFWAYLQSRGERIGAALYEGSNVAGGYAVPVTVDSQIVPLAPQEMAIRRLATVVPTTNDVKMPIKAAHGTAASKAESGGSNNAFGGASPTLTQKTLSAFMAGDIQDASWELLQDVPVAQQFVVSDLVIAQQQFEEAWYITGSGSGQPEGLLTGCDTGVTITGAHLVQGVITLDSIYDLVASLKATYHANAAFLMQRPVALAIRKLQRQANLFEPVFTRNNSQDYLLGYPVEYSGSMPDGTTDQDKPIVFGDFKAGFVIGDRGGSGINVKVLDQPKANLGITQLLAYRRTDSRVRRSEALKSLKLATGA
jgi:HK97 family phage major capsid protein